jgi:hypothetical protein
VTDTTGKTATFHLVLRLVDANQIPFSSHDFQLTWGSGPPLKGTTTDQGLIDLNVDASVTTGKVQLGRTVNNKFVPKITIPLQVHQGVQDFGTEENFGGGKAQLFNAYDIEWRLVNLMFLPEIPTRPRSIGLPPPPSVPPETQDAVRRFKAANHVALGLSDWLSGNLQDLNTVQDDVVIKLLLQQHDNLSSGDAAAKLSRHQQGSSWDPL